MTGITSGALPPYVLAALERAISDNEARATALAKAGDYSAQFPESDADSLRQVLQLVTSTEGSYQSRVQDWMQKCFGPEISGDRMERNHRFLEESLELVQACGATASEAHQLVDYVFNRPKGEPTQEAGGVAVTLAALCSANGIHGTFAAEEELARVWTKIEAIRAKQAAKPRHSPLPA